MLQLLWENFRHHLDQLIRAKAMRKWCEQLLSHIPKNISVQSKPWQ